MTESTSAHLDPSLAHSVHEVARYWHQDPYYDRAEKSDWLGAFWSLDNVNRPFRRLLNTMNLRVTAELACGHGRHAEQIYRQVPALILIDVVSENVEYCRERFKNASNVAVMQNNGATFQALPDASLTAIYCYDAMVHFEYDVVLSYIKDAARVLQPGGRALFHHSNLSAFPGRDHRLNPGGRNFMSQELFVHAARRDGFEVVESLIMDWDAPHTDCLTLLEKQC
ncbi:MAG TPA: class I SAM-dependent methyltransferase [Candidatus Baltobacteraceae bacterium]|jgi:SAM-dependent methyltransferase|nr:class I SAM-dependent methyltransferase [Candidatus Baltobacteraceae bacterium]